jgi:hypothetical protein
MDSQDTRILHNQGFISQESPSLTSSFTVKGNGPEELLRISEDGFWVRGIKVEQDPGEAKAVYQGFLTILQTRHSPDVYRESLILAISFAERNEVPPLDCLERWLKLVNP